MKLFNELIDEYPDTCLIRKKAFFILNNKITLQDFENNERREQILNDWKQS